MALGHYRKLSCELEGETEVEIFGVTTERVCWERRELPTILWESRQGKPSFPHAGFQQGVKEEGHAGSAWRRIKQARGGRT